ncbi:MAG: DJ-1/PfpI family protein [Candidatus Micrarchaeia archaeon]
MAKVSIIIAPNDFKDETLAKAELFLDKKGIEHEILSTAEATCKGYHGATRKQDARADEFEPAYTDAVLIVDGPGVESSRLYENRQILDRIKVAHENKKLIAAVGNAIKVVAKSNVIKDTKIASIDDEDAKRLVGLYRGVMTNAPLVMDKGILTASDDADMQEFVGAIADALGIK